MTMYPQILVNVQGVDKSRMGSAPEIAAAVAAAEAELGTLGRVLVGRVAPSQWSRVMVEAADPLHAERVPPAAWPTPSAPPSPEPSATAPLRPLRSPRYRTLHALASDS